MASEKIVQLTPDNFDAEVLQSKTPVLVDFWAEWCAPCKAIAPILAELADEVGDSFKIGKLNVDASQEIAGRYGIRAIPTLLIFSDGSVKDQIVGLRSKNDLKAALEKHAR